MQICKLGLRGALLCAPISGPNIGAMDMRLPPGLTTAPATDAPPPLRLLQRWTPPAAPVVAAPAPHGLPALKRALGRVFLGR